MKYWELIQKIYPGFPRELGLDGRVGSNEFDRFFVDSLEELKSKVNFYINDKRIYIGLYSNGKLDKVWFDFDGENALEEANKLRDYLDERNLQRFWVFSGGGIHCYILTKDWFLIQNPKDCLYNVHRTISGEAKFEADRQVFGDIRRIVGLPGTVNHKRGRNVVFIKEEMLDLLPESLASYAIGNKVGEFEISGDQQLYIPAFDSNIPEIPKVDIQFSSELQHQIDSD